MKKKVFIFVYLMMVCSLLSATDLESVLEKAKENSAVYKGYELSYDSALISKQLKELKSSEPEISISGSMDYSKDNISVALNELSLSFPSDDNYNLILKSSGSLKYSNKNAVLGKSNISLTLPSVGDDIKVEVGTSFSDIYLNEKKPYSILPSLSVGKDFVYSSYSDTRSDIRDLISDIQRENNYKTNVMNFENSLINAIISIMQAQTRLNSTEISYNRALTTYENDKYLGTLEEGSLPDIAQKLRLDASKASLESQRTSLEKSKKDFLHQYGFDFEVITQVRDANLDFEEKEAGNSSVLIAELNLESARQDLEVAKGYKDTLSVSAKASGVINGNSSVKSNKMDLNATATYKSTSKNFSVSTSINESIGKDAFGNKISLVPSVSVFGSWSSKPTQTKEEELTIKSLTNALQERENAYNNALYNYRTSAQSLANDIDVFKTNMEQLKIQTEYDKAVLDYQTKLFERGLATKQIVDDARTTYENDLQSELIYKLQALVLENRIKIIEL